MNTDERGIEKLVFTFEGDNNVDINLLIKTLEGVSNSYLNTIQAIESTATVKLQVEAFNKGSFEVVINSLIDNIPPMFVAMQTVIPSVKTFLEIIKIKKELKGQKPKVISTENGITKIVNHKGEEHYHDCNITNIYLNNPRIDKSATDIFLPLTVNNKKSVKLSVDDEAISIKENEFSEMAVPIIEEPTLTDETSEVESYVNTELLLRKPDLMGETMWGFKYDENFINATVEDFEFIRKVKTGEIKELYSGVRIPVYMKIVATLDVKLNPIHKKYYILDVTGDIIEPDNYEQMHL